MSILVAPDSFKGSLSATQFCQIAQEEANALDINICCMPIADGGEGSIDALQQTLDLKLEKVAVNGPNYGQSVTANIASMNGLHYLVELAQASGLHLKPKSLCAMDTCSYGTGEMINYALNQGAKKITVFLGGSAVNDGGQGLLRALGAQLLNYQSQAIPPGNRGLADLSQIDLTTLNPKLYNCEIILAVDVTAPLLGTQGAIETFGPQKGLQQPDIPIANDNLAHFAQLIAQQHPCRYDQSTSGSGAAGGCAFALMQLPHITVRSGFEIVAEYTGIRSLLSSGNIDTLITGEGRLDSQSVMGKGPIELLKLGSNTVKHKVIICGQLGETIPNFVTDEQVTVLPLFANQQEYQHHATQTFMRLRTHLAQIFRLTRTSTR